MQIQNSQSKRIILSGSKKAGHLFKAIGSEEEICTLMSKIHNEYGIFIATVGHIVELDINVGSDAAYINNKDEISKWAKYYSIERTTDESCFVQLRNPLLYTRVKETFTIKSELCFLEAFALDWFEYSGLNDENKAIYETDATEFSINTMNAIDRINSAIVLTSEEEDFIVEYYKCIDYWYKKLGDIEAPTLDQIATKYLFLSYINENEIVIDNSEYRIIDPRKNNDTWAAFKNLYPPHVNYSESEYLLLGAIDSEGVAIGALAMKFEVEEYTVTWLYVVPEKRRMGVGTYLIENVMAFVNSTLEFYDLKIQFTSKDLGMREFIEKTGAFEINDGVVDYLVNYEELIDNPLFEKMLDLNVTASSYLDLSDTDKKHILDKVKASRIMDITDYAILEKELIPELSLCNYKSEDDFAIIWIKKGLNENVIEFALFFANDRVKAAEVLAAVIKTYVEKYKGYSLKITPVSDEADGLLEKFSPNRSVHGNRYTAEWVL